MASIKALRQFVAKLITPNRKGVGFLAPLFPPVGLLIIGLLVAAYLVNAGKLSLPSFAAAAAPVQTAGVSLSGSDCAAEAEGCFIEDATVRWNDINALAAGTDQASAIWIASRQTTIADDATATFGVGTESEVIYADAAADTYRQKGKICIPCSGDVDIVRDVYAGGAPTITVIGSNGATVLADGTEEAVGANGQPTFTVRVRAPADQCSAHPDYGALPVVHYDRDVWSRIDSSLAASPYAISSLADVAVYQPTDAQVAFLWNEPGVLLCDNKQVDYTISPLADGDNPDLTGNMTIEWYPVQLYRSTIDNSFNVGIQNNAGTLQRSGGNTTVGQIYVS